MQVTLIWEYGLENGLWLFTKCKKWTLGEALGSKSGTWHVSSDLNIGSNTPPPLQGYIMSRQICDFGDCVPIVMIYNSQD